MNETEKIDKAIGRESSEHHHLFSEFEHKVDINSLEEEQQKILQNLKINSALNRIAIADAENELRNIINKYEIGTDKAVDRAIDKAIDKQMKMDNILDKIIDKKVSEHYAEL